MLKNNLMDGISVLDGGLSTELERLGHFVHGDPLWSSRVLYTKPEAIVDVHNSYLRCGAQIITTASYQASIPGFQKHLGLTCEESIKLIKLSVELARRARDEHCRNNGKDPKDVLVAGSVGSYGAALADGSEYSGSFCCKVTQEDLIKWHRPRIEGLIEAGVDILAFETIPALKEAEALLKLLKELSNTKAWLSFSCQSMHKTAAEEDIGLVALKCMKMSSSSQLVAVGVNCCLPEHAESLLKDISQTSSDFPLIVYPNSGEKYDSSIGWTGPRETQKEAHLASYITSGAKIIGGCCRTTPEEISVIAKYLKEKLSV